MIVTKSWIENNYNKYNNLYFGGVLPSIEFKISRSKKTWGYAAYTYNRFTSKVTPISITISNYFDSPEEVKLTTLLHEMIHIYDYTVNPTHFVNNGRKVKYDAHGYWFKNEAARIYKLSGLDIQQYVTKEEKEVSKLSERAAQNVENQKEVALVCVVNGSISSWFFKTNIWQAETALDVIGNISWEREIGKVKSIKFYKFNDPKLAAHRSCGKRIRGWKFDKFGLLRKLEEIKATETRKFYNKSVEIVHKLAV